MTRTTRAARSLHDLAERSEADGDRRNDDAVVLSPASDPAGRAQERREPLVDTQPVYFVDQPRIADEHPAASAPGAGPERDGGRLEEMLERAGDPVVLRTHESTGSWQRRRGSSARWRNDPHVLGRAAAALVVLMLLAVCAAVGVHVLG